MGQIIGKEHLLQITDNIPGLTTYHCAIVGLDTVGKTTVLYRLKFDQYVNAAPTIGFNCDPFIPYGPQNSLKSSWTPQDNLHFYWVSTV